MTKLICDRCKADVQAMEWIRIRVDNVFQRGIKFHEICESCYKAMQSWIKEYKHD